VISGASTEYAIGTFDGTKFGAETSKLPGHRGRGYYAPQTFSDEPEGRANSDRLAAYRDRRNAIQPVDEHSLWNCGW
jgi:sucrose-6-phosphate hydrolase SacC (GH32 family)